MSTEIAHRPVCFLLLQKVVGYLFVFSTCSQVETFQ